MRRTLLLAAIYAFAGAAPAMAAGNAPAPSLKAEVTVSGELVRIGDLVEHAGLAADIPVFRAPDLGSTGMVSTARVVEAVRPHGLNNVATHGLAEVAVTRLAREISLKEIEERIAAALSGSQGLGEAGDLAVALDREALALQLEPSAGTLRVRNAHYDRYSGRFDVSFAVEGSVAARKQRLRYTGTIAETAAVAVPIRALERGSVIREGDIVMERRPKTTVQPETLSNIENVVGLAARRPVRAGQMIRTADLMKPELVIKNEMVTITYQMPGLMLTLRGKALESGAEGDVVNVLNAQTKRTLQGVVSGPGRVALAAMAVAAPAPIVTGSISPAAPAAAPVSSESAE